MSHMQMMENCNKKMQNTLHGAGKAFRLTEILGPTPDNRSQKPNSTKPKR